MSISNEHAALLAGVFATAFAEIFGDAKYGVSFENKVWPKARSAYDALDGLAFAFTVSDTAPKPAKPAPRPKSAKSRSRGKDHRKVK